MLQNKYNEYDIFPVFYGNGLFKIYEKFQKHEQTLNDICKGNIFRGISLDINKHMLEYPNTQKSQVIYRGASIERFGIKKTFYISTESITKEKTSRLLQNKIILQNLCSKEGGIFATLSNETELNNDTVTNVIPQGIDCRYILGLLNSKIANIYIIYLTFLHSNFTMHTDKTYIGKFPIALSNKQQEKLVIKLVDKLQLIKDKYSKEFFEYYNELNDLLFDIYQFNVEDKQLINSILKEGMSKKQNG